jgi:hypothetical protein
MGGMPGGMGGMGGMAGMGGMVGTLVKTPDDLSQYGPRNQSADTPGLRGPYWLSSTGVCDHNALLGLALPGCRQIGYVDHTGCRQLLFVTKRAAGVGVLFTRVILRSKHRKP